MASAVLTLQGPRLDDPRRLQRLRALVSSWVSGLEQGLPQALAGSASLKAARRFFATRAITPERILAAARPDLLARCAGSALLQAALHGRVQHGRVADAGLHQYSHHEAARHPADTRYGQSKALGEEHVGCGPFPATNQGEIRW